jgi:ATP synthase protein I
MESDQEDKKYLKIYRDVSPYLGLGFQLAASIILMFFLGWWLDKKFECSPLLTIIFSFLGGFAGIYNVIKVVLELNKKKKNEKNI